jgi:phage repressor protein C with HTH and peptisase S24 domain
MLPTLRPGDCLLVRYGARVRPGDLVVARPWTRPDLLVIKRAVAPVAGGWVVASDNPATPWKHGEVDVLARVLFRYWRSCAS